MPRNTFCVVVVARDGFDAVYSAQQMITNVINGGPPVGIRVVSPAAPAPFGIYSQMRLAAAEPGELSATDVLTFAWKLTGPDGMTVVPPACPDVKPDGAEICFPVTAAGLYRVGLTTTEGTLSRTANPPFDLAVEDRPPCIRQTEPQYTSAPVLIGLYDQERVFQIREVDDDGDPYPTPQRESQRAFVWSVRLKREAEVAARARLRNQAQRHVPGVRHRPARVPAGRRGGGAGRVPGPAGSPRSVGAQLLALQA